MQLAAEALERRARRARLAVEKLSERSALRDRLQHALAIERELRELRAVAVVRERTALRCDRPERALRLRDAVLDVAACQEVRLDRARERVRELRACLRVAERELDDAQIARRSERRVRAERRASLDALATARDELVGLHVVREVQEVVALLHEVEDVVAAEERKVRPQAAHHLLEQLRGLRLRHARLGDVVVVELDVEVGVVDDREAEALGVLVRLGDLVDVERLQRHLADHVAVLHEEIE